MKKAMIVVFAATALIGCGGGSSSPTAPSTVAAPVSTVDPRVVSCGIVSYRGTNESVQCSIPGQTQQPSAVHKFFTGRTDCLIVTCSAGCASTVRVGTNSGGSCR